MRWRLSDRGRILHKWGRSAPPRLCSGLVNSKAHTRKDYNRGDPAHKTGDCEGDDQATKASPNIRRKLAMTRAGLTPNRRGSP